MAIEEKVMSEIARCAIVLSFEGGVLELKGPEGESNEDEHLDEERWSITPRGQAVRATKGKLFGE